MKEMLRSDSEVACNAVLLQWYLDPEFQSKVEAQEASAAARAGIGGSYSCALSDPENKTHMRGIERCREALALAHHQFYKSHYPQLDEQPWVRMIGTDDVQAYVSKPGMVFMHAECAETGRVVGYICGKITKASESAGDSDDEAEHVSSSVMIHHIIVLPAHRGGGVARQMFEAFCKHLEHKGHQLPKMTLNVAELNIRAVEWYRRIGFSVVRLMSMQLKVSSETKETVPVTLMTMKREERPAPGALFGRHVMGIRVAVWPGSVPPAFRGLAARRPWAHWLPMVKVFYYEPETGNHRPGDERVLDLNRLFATGVALFDRSMHDIFPDKEPLERVQARMERAQKGRKLNPWGISKKE